MDYDFTLILIVLTAITGVIWLVDHLFFLPARRIRSRETQTALLEPSIVEYSRSFFPVLLVVLVIRSFLVEPFQIPSGSMLPTLKVGDFILVNKFDYGIRVPVTGHTIIEMGKPARGDVMVFRKPGEESVNYIKRVIGVPGDRIRYEGQQLSINGQQVREEYLGKIPCESQPPRICYEYNEWLDGDSHRIQKMVRGRNPSVEGAWVVPEGQYMVAGDNRDNSKDSRPVDGIGMVPDRNIVGRAFAVWMHWERFLSIPSFSTVGSIE